MATSATGPALTDFSKHSEKIVAGAVEKKWAQFVNADNRERGRKAATGLANVGLTLALSGAAWWCH